MSYTSILVYVDDTEQAAQRIEYAAYLAAEHGAHLTGVCVPRHAERPPGISPLVTEMFERDRAEQFERQARDVCSAFEHLAQRVGATSVESRIVHGDVVKSLTETGRYYDVVVLSRPREDAQGGELTVQEGTDDAPRAARGGAERGEVFRRSVGPALLRARQQAAPGVEVRADEFARGDTRAARPRPASGHVREPGNRCANAAIRTRVNPTRPGSGSSQQPTGCNAGSTSPGQCLQRARPCFTRGCIAKKS